MHFSFHPRVTRDRESRLSARFHPRDPRGLENGTLRLFPAFPPGYLDWLREKTRDLKKKKTQPRVILACLASSCANTLC